MKELVPKRLQKGDLIGIVSPSDPVENKFRKAFDTGVDWFKQHGFRVKIASNALGNSLGYSASAQKKASDINEMFSNKEVKAIICSQGGQNANSVLPYLDYDFPILQCDDFGHNTPNTTIPIGVKAKLDAANCEVELLEPCVK